MIFVSDPHGVSRAGRFPGVDTDENVTFPWTTV